MATDWTERIRAFSRSPSLFLASAGSEAFLSDLLRELRDDRASCATKVLLLAPLCEHTALLCGSDSVGEETALDLLSVLAQCPPRSLELRRQLLVALTCVLVCSSCASRRSRTALDFLDLLLRMSQDTCDGDGEQRSLRATACDCLRELEACCPGLLAQRLELLGGLRLQETSRLHQAYALLQTEVLRNAVFQLTWDTEAGAERLKAFLEGNTSNSWEAHQEAPREHSRDSAMLSSLTLGPMGSVPSLRSGPDCRELRSVVSALLEESYLLSPPSQAALLHRLTEVVAMAPSIPPTVFRTQLLRLLGTTEVCLLHVTLLMKCVFTDSLFSAEDEAFLLRRLVVLAQHPLLTTADKLFHMDCILHFPENRPIGCSDCDEALPVLLTPRLALLLMPTVFNDSATLLARLNLQCLVYVEEGEEGAAGLAHLCDLLVALLHIVENGRSRELVVTFFRAAFLLLYYFNHMDALSTALTEQLCGLYLHHPHLAPHILNLADRTKERLPAANWAVGLLRGLQSAISGAPLSRLTMRDLHWHLKVLARAAEEAELCQRASLSFLSGVITPSSSSLCAGGDWRLGNAVLAVCRRLLVHHSLDALLVPLADILQHLAGHYGDTDIQDHARLYYTLLTVLSREKLGAVLAQDAAQGGCPVKKRALSCVMAEGEGLANALTVHQAEKAIIQLTEAWPEEPGQRPDQDTGLKEPGRPPEPHAQPEERGLPPELDGISPADAALEAYKALLSGPQFAPELLLKYQLTYVGAPEPGFEQLFSIRLSFQLSDEHYEPLGDVRVPCLFRERPPPAVQLRLIPRRPFPTTLHVSAVFTTQDGLTWHAALPDVHVSFQQTFQPRPLGWAGALSPVFDHLWEEMCSETGGCALSLYCCRLTQAELHAVLFRHLSTFLLSQGAESKLLLFLPPRSHILLRVSSEEDAAHFNIATDDWRLLPHLNAYLLSITQPKEGPEAPALSETDAAPPQGAPVLPVTPKV